MKSRNLVKSIVGLIIIQLFAFSIINSSSQPYLNFDSKELQFDDSPNEINSLQIKNSILSSSDTEEAGGLLYSTFIGETNQWIDDSDGFEIAIDEAGGIYIVGTTDSISFPTTPGSFDETYNGYLDIFVCKVKPDGTTLEYSTFVGGSSEDYGTGIVVDNEGYAYITGYTESFDFPTTRESFDESHNGESDAFVCKLSPDGTTLEYSTFVGGSEVDFANGIAIDDIGNSFIVGSTWNGITNFPTTTGAYNEVHNGDHSDAFLCKLNANGSTLDYSTIIGSSESDHGRAIAIDNLGCAYITGMYYDDNYKDSTSPFPGNSLEINPPWNFYVNSFISKFSANGSSLEYSVILKSYNAYDIAVDPLGCTYIVGKNEYYRQNYLRSEIFVCKIDANGTKLEYEASIGGKSEDQALGLAIDIDNNAYIIGYTYSPDIPKSEGAFDLRKSWNRDVFICKLNANGSTFEYSTYLGKSQRDSGFDIALDNQGYVYIVGITNCKNFPTTKDAFDDSFSGEYGVFLCKFKLTPKAPTLNPEHIIGITIIGYLGLVFTIIIVHKVESMKNTKDMEQVE